MSLSCSIDLHVYFIPVPAILAIRSPEAVHCYNASGFVFIVQDWLAVWGFLCFHMSLRTALINFVQNVLMEIVLTQYIALGGM